MRKDVGARRWPVTVAIAVLVLGALLAGCGGDDDGGGSGSGGGGGSSTKGGSSASTKVYGAGDSIRVSTGQTFVVELEANPTTGYSWASETNPNAELVKSTQVTNSTLPGAPGMQQLTFRATASGSSTLVLNYARPFEPDAPPAQTESFPLTVE
jgi:inhibitor of cysteine peptidase